MSLQIPCSRPTKPLREWASSFSSLGRSSSFLVLMRTCATSTPTLVLLKLDLPQMPKMLLVRQSSTFVRRSLAPIFGFLGCFSACQIPRFLGPMPSSCRVLVGEGRTRPSIPPPRTCIFLPQWTLVPSHMRELQVALFVVPWWRRYQARRSLSRPCFRQGTSQRPVFLQEAGLRPPSPQE